MTRQSQRALAISRRAGRLQIAVAGATYLKPSDPLPDDPRGLCAEIHRQVQALERELDRERTFEIEGGGM